MVETTDRIMRVLQMIQDALSDFSIRLDHLDRDVDHLDRELDEMWEGMIAASHVGNWERTR